MPELLKGDNEGTSLGSRIQIWIKSEGKTMGKRTQQSVSKRKKEVVIYFECESCGHWTTAYKRKGIACGWCGRSTLTERRGMSQ